MNKNILLGGTILVLIVSVILTIKALNNFEDNLDKEALEKANQIITEDKKLKQNEISFKGNVEQKEETLNNSIISEDNTENTSVVKEDISESSDLIETKNSETTNEEDKEWSTFDKKEEVIKLEPITVTAEPLENNSNTEQINNDSEEETTSEIKTDSKTE